MIGAIAALLYLAEAAAPAPPAGDAEALFREGLKAYDAKEYGRAIAAFEAAHKLSPLPEILFDIAMARRALGDCRRAAAGFDAFIAAAPADDPLLARARARRAELGSCSDAPGETGEAASAKSAAADSPPPAAPLAAPNPNAFEPPTLIATPEMAAPNRRERPWLRDVCVGSLAGTGLLGVGGLVFGWQAIAAQNEAEEARMWDFAAVRADERGRTLGQVATALLVSAGVTAALAAASCVATMRSGTDR